MHNIFSLFMFKELVSPFHSLVQCTTRSKQSRPMCNCDHDDEENDFGMAPECAFVCNNVAHHNSHNTTKKRRTHSHAKKTKRNKK